jgi:hypothetical protein
MDDTSGRATRPITISAADLNLLLFTIKELEGLAENVMTRITNVEDIMLTHLDQSLDQPQAPKEGADSIPSNSSNGFAKVDQDELRKLESETGTGPDRKFRGVIVHSLF